jgi:hypothetical protein
MYRTSAKKRASISMITSRLLRWFVLAGLVLSANLFLPQMLLNCTDAQSLGDGTTLAPAKQGKKVGLRDRLVVGLKALSKSDLAFIDRVVIRVNSGQLPQRLVDQTFFWARDRVATTTTTGGKERRAIIYFRPALTEQAKRLGVNL